MISGPTDTTDTLTITLLNGHARHGGAERCARDVLHGLRDRGHDARLFVGHAESEDDLTDHIVRLPHIPGERILHKITHGLLGYTDAVLPSPVRLARRHPIFRQAHVVHAHNLNGGWFNLRALPVLAEHVPIVITVHDMWLLTGDCDFVYDCERWLDKCGQCPVFDELPFRGRGSVGGLDFTTLNLRTKDQIFRRIPHGRIVFVTPSHWLHDQVKKSHLGHHRVEVIPYSVDPDTFKPADRAECRKALSLPPEGLLFTGFASSWDTERKGPGHMRALSKALRERDLGHVVLAGPMSPEAERSFHDVGALTIPGFQTVDRLRQLMSAGNGTLLMSKGENLPFVVSESLCCGAPPLARDVGGVKEMFSEGEGFLLDREDPVSTAVKASERLHAMSEEERDAMSRAARAQGERMFSPTRMLERYEALYRELIG